MPVCSSLFAHGMRNEMVAREHQKMKKDKSAVVRGRKCRLCAGQRDGKQHFLFIGHKGNATSSKGVQVGESYLTFW